MKHKNQAKLILVGNVALGTMLVAALIYSAVMVFIAPDSSLTETTKSTYFLTAFQCTLGFLLMFLPLILTRKFHLDVPFYMKAILIVYVYIAIFLGEVRSFFYRFQYWDILCHTFSGLVFALLSFSAIQVLNKNKKIHLEMSPIFIALFAFCFAVAIGAVWEIFEFAVDEIFGSNMQKFIPEAEGIFNGGASKEHLNGTLEQIGTFYRTPAGYKYALMDTMEDIIVDVVGALVMSAVGYFIIRNKKDSFEKLVIKKIEQPESEAEGVLSESEREAEKKESGE